MLLNAQSDSSLQEKVNMLLYCFPDRFCPFQRSKTTLFAIPVKAGMRFLSGCQDKAETQLQ